MDCKDWGKKREKFGKGAKCKEKVKQKKSAGNCKICVKRQRSFGKEDFYENEVKRRGKSGKAKFGKDSVKRQQEVGKTAAGGRINGRAEISSTRQVASEGVRQEEPERKTTTTDGNKMRGGRGMVEKEGRQASRYLAAENGKAQKAASERRKGTFYLMLASWWPTVAGRKRWARKGVERRLRAFEEPQ